jgi:hypothetical protein
MKYIIKIESNQNGSRTPVQSWIAETAPDGFAIFPEDMVTTFNNANGFVNITVENGVVVSITENKEAKTAWEAIPKPVPVPTAEEDMTAMLVDQEYRLTLIELGVNQ